MSNQAKYKKVFMDTFSLKEEQLESDVAYNAIPEWDSIGHMSMIAEIEGAFNITIDTDDIINFSSYKKGYEILGKYGIEM